MDEEQNFKLTILKILDKLKYSPFTQPVTQMLLVLRSGK